MAVLTVKNAKYNLALDLNVGVHVFDAKWNYLLLLNFTASNLYPVYYMIVVNEEFYFSFTGTYGLAHTTSQLKYLNIYTNNSGNYRSLCFDQVNKTIIAANWILSQIDIFSQNLTLLNSITLKSPPHGVCVYGSRIYVSYYSGSSNISVIQNGYVINSFSTLCSAKLVSLNVDSHGLIAVSCFFNNSLYLYHVNG